ncbi:hypothetical protein OV450_7060 [Actinobacteria bacterium OV450]|nr:hypothetical protein OV450_7060 [Actinobacteria bacterium OV450]
MSVEEGGQVAAAGDGCHLVRVGELHLASEVDEKAGTDQVADGRGSHPGPQARERHPQGLRQPVAANGAVVQGRLPCRGWRRVTRGHCSIMAPWAWGNQKVVIRARTASGQTYDFAKFFFPPKAGVNVNVRGSYGSIIWARS